MIETIDEHDLDDAVEDLGCGGNCLKCPCPDRPDPTTQVVACLIATRENVDDVEYSEEIEQILYPLTALAS